MAQSTHIPDAVHGESQAQAQSVRYCYVVKHPDASVYWTNHDRQVSVANLPAAWRHGTPQTFDPVQVAHGQIDNSTEFSDRETVVQVSTQDEALRRYFLEAPATTIEVAIIRLSTSALDEESPGNLEYTRHCQVVQSGALGTISIVDGAVLASLTPTTFDSNKAVPRFYFERTCNHMLYDTRTCMIGQRNFMLDTTIKSIDRPNRTLVVGAVHSSDITFGGGGNIGGSVFIGGYIFHEDTGQRFGIQHATFDTGATETTFILGHWMELLEVSDAIECFWGCNRTTAHCERFSNLTNFGGFPYIPSQNPSLHGVAP